MIEKHSGDSLVSRAEYGRAAARQQLKDYAGASEDVEAFLKSDPKPAGRSDASYVLGLAQEGLKKFAEAAATFNSLLDGDPNYASADKVLYELAWSRKSTESEQPAADAFARLAREHGDSPLAAESWFNVGEFAYHNKKDFKAAAEAYSAALAKAGKGELGEKVAHKLGWADFQAHEYAKPTMHSQRNWNGIPKARSRPMPRSWRRMFVQAGKIRAGLGRVRKSARQDPASDTTPPATPGTKPAPVPDTAAGPKPSSPEFVELALLHAGQAAGQVKNWDESLSLLKRLLAEFPDSPHRLEAIYEEGSAEQNLGHQAEALKLYESVAEKTESIVGGAGTVHDGGSVLRPGESQRGDPQLLQGHLWLRRRPIAGPISHLASQRDVRGGPLFRGSQEPRAGEKVVQRITIPVS